MNPNIEKHLMKDEKLLWEGKSEPFKLLDTPYRVIYPVIWGVSIAIGIAFVALYIPFFFRSGSTFGQFIMAFLCFIAPPLFVSLEPIVIKRSIENKLTYILTDKRAIVLNSGKIKALKLEKGTPVKLEKLSNGSDIIYIGEDACQSKTFSSRANAVYAFHNPTKNPEDYTGLVFYSVKDAQAVYDKMAV